jgi:hypothetical protein
MRKWLAKTVPEGSEWLFDSKTVAGPFCRNWVKEHPGCEITLFFRRDMRPTTRYRSLDGEAVTEKLHRRSSTGKPSKRAGRCAAELIDIELQNEVRLRARDAVAARQALIEVWKEGLQRNGLVWTPAGVLVVTNSPRVQRARNSSFSEGRKPTQRKVRIGLKPNPEFFPEPKTTEYTYRQFGSALQRGLIEASPRREPRSFMDRVVRPTSAKLKRMARPRR